jgi:predicted P-loop ATPase
MSAPDMQSAALALAAEGFRVFPLPPGQKAARMPGWQKKATINPEFIHTHWTVTPAANIGVATGAGLLVLDEDPRAGSDQSMQDLALVHDELPETRTVRTPSGGRHRYFRVAAGLRVANSVSKLGAGLDIRGDGGYVVAPPSVLVDGPKQTAGAYTLETDSPIADAPEWLIVLATTARPIETPTESGPTLIELTAEQITDIKSALWHPGLMAEAESNQVWTEIGYALRRHGAQGRDIWLEFSEAAPKGRGHQDGAAEAWWQNHPADAVTTDYRHIFTMATAHGWNNPATATPASAEEFEVEKSAAESPKLKRSKGGKIFPTISNVAAALRCPTWAGFNVAFDVFRDEVMVSPVNAEEWRQLGDDGTTKLMEYFEKLGFSPIARETMRNTISMVAHETQFDSARLWLDTLKWDSVPRVERFLETYCDAKSSPEYARAVSRYMWTALAARVLEPACQADMMPVLIGRQGAKKTSAIAELSPSPDQFVEVSLTEHDVDLSRKLRGKLVAEIGELRGLASRDLESIKTFISRRYEEWVPKYKEFSSRFARRFIFIGSTNDMTFLTDETGHRRFLPVEVGDIDIPKIRADKLQLWAEAAALWKARGVLWQDAERLATAVHAKHVVVDTWEPLITKWLDDSDDLAASGNGPPRCARPFTTGEILAEALSLNPVQMTNVAEKRAARLLRLLGFEQKPKRIAGRLARVWMRPGTTPAIESPTPDPLTL